MPSSRPVLTLIDASGFIFRAYHAIADLSTSRGVPTNAVYGFTRMLLKTLRELQPHPRGARPSTRRAAPAGSKSTPATRRTAQGRRRTFLHQFELVRQVVDALRVPVLEFAGWEADDVIATLALAAKEQGFDVHVVTGDKDFMQLVDDRVSLYDPMLRPAHRSPRGEGAAAASSPAQMRDYLALVGDPIDNVPKVPGIGPKTAAELITAVRRRGDAARPAGRGEEAEDPRGHREHRRELLRAQAAGDVPRPISRSSTDVSRFARRPIDGEQAGALFTELEFYKLLQEMPPSPDAAAARPMGKTGVVADREALVALVEAIRAHGRVALVPALRRASGHRAAGRARRRCRGRRGLRLAPAPCARCPAAAGGRSAGGPRAGAGRPGAWRRTPTTPRRSPCCCSVWGSRSGDSVRTSSCSPISSTPRAASTPWRTWRRERLRLELPAPYDAAAARRAGSGLADRRPGGGGRGVRRSGRRRWSGSPRACGGTSSRPG